MYRPTELLDFLRSLGREPKKSLSQNFLIDGNIIKKIIRVGKILPGSSVIEIGSGPGALTEALLQAGAHVVAVETDRILAQALSRLPKASEKLDIVEADALKIPLDQLFDFFLPSKNKIHLLGNLPYHIATALLNRFVIRYDKIDQIIIMVQEELARRMSAKPGEPSYGSLTLFLSFYADVHYQFKVNRTCFYPIPKVDSAIVILKLKAPPEGVQEEVFFKMTRTAFEQRRKSLRSSLKELFPPKAVEEALEKISLTPLTRPEELTLHQWLNLHHILQDSLRNSL